MLSFHRKGHYCSSYLRIYGSPSHCRLLATNSTNLTSYQRKTPIEHVLLRPGMYVGQVEIATTETWVFDKEKKMMKKETIRYSPALLKIFDEILVNAADNRRRDPKMSVIKVSISMVGNELEISVENDGIGIPIAVHPTEQLYIPELIFGHLLTGSNFDDNENLMTGGRHGYGAKLTNIFSKQFTVETYSSSQQQLYKQIWGNSMASVSPATITSKSLPKDFTRITFRPDLAKFGYIIDSAKMTTKSPKTSSKSNKSDSIATDDIDANHVITDFIKIASRRVYDIAGTVSPAIKVYLNKSVIPIKSFVDYVNLFTDTESTVMTANDGEVDDADASETPVTQKDPIFYANINDRWSLAVKKSYTGEFENLSFVNCVWTPRGGTHVNHVTSQIVKAFESEIAKLKLPSITSGSIRSRLMVFLSCHIENPTFDSQTKDTLTKKVTEYGSTCALSSSHTKKLIKVTGLLDDIKRYLLTSERMQLEKLTSLSPNKSKQKQTFLLDIPKLEDAHDAGHKDSLTALDCTLILTEGDSAKALAVAGIEVVGRKKFGVLPLRGKILNVRDVKVSKVAENEELLQLVKALGLSFSKDYANGLVNQGLRYGHVMIMCDQDHDGSHIKGLIINFFHHFWPNLLKIEGFMQQFITPLVKVKTLGKSTSKRDPSTAVALFSKKGDKRLKSHDIDTNIRSFYSLPEFEEWIQSKEYKDHAAAYSIKYYKGLGTNTSAEGQIYFQALKNHQKSFEKYSETHENDLIDLVFNKNRASDRREWLSTTYNPQAFINPSASKVSYSEFINKELIQFSYADNCRSLPCIIDGLKPSQRKVLYGCFKRKLTQEIKVVQLAGYVAEQTAYHHGEASLHATIIHMAQDYVGSNNVPLLEPSGQFGTRAQGGQDYASPRYIFTRLSPIARYLFPESDDSLLQYLTEDGQLVEPKYYIPIVPTILLNGSEGIGTGLIIEFRWLSGWSTNIPCFDLKEVIDHITALVSGKQPQGTLKPSYRGFHGSITLSQDSNQSTYISGGTLRVKKDGVIEITELPVGVWTHSYKDFLRKMIEKNVIVRFMEDHTTATVKFTVYLTQEQKEKDYNEQQLMMLFRLENLIKLTNMHGFNSNGQIKLYSSVEDIIKEFYEIRLEAYRQRKEIMLKQLEYQNILNSNKARFVQEILAGNLDIFPSKSSDQKGQSFSYKEDDLVSQLSRKGYAAIIENRVISDMNSDTADKKAYSYLLDMPIQSLTQERSMSLQKNAERSHNELRMLSEMSERELWLKDLEELMNIAIDLNFIESH